MIINSSLSITHYAGQQSLALTTQPNNLTSDQLVDFNKLIQSVSAIYGSQSSTNGSVPKFWTYLSGTINGVKIYAPHANSTLTSLEPKSSYYFILRDSLNLPLNIPAAGGPLEGFLDPISNLPSIKIASDSTQSTNFNATTNVYNFNIQLSGLQSYKNYTYSVDVIDAEWPTYFIGKPSGTVTATKNVTNTIQSIAFDVNKLIFCVSGVCDPYPELVNPHSVPEYPKFWNSNVDYRVILRGSIKCNDCLNTNTVYSDYIILKYTAANIASVYPDATLKIT